MVPSLGYHHDSAVKNLGDNIQLPLLFPQLVEQVINAQVALDKSADIGLDVLLLQNIGELQLGCKVGNGLHGQHPIIQINDL